ncbi:MAG: carboxylesterase family protein [Prevotella sp.]|nr:carboxylesterase family protein [Prevotella sp.]
MKKTLFLTLAFSLALSASAAKKQPVQLQFDASKGVSESLTMPQGDVVRYTAYRKLYFVTNVEDSTYQYMNVFVPEGATQQSPIFLRTYVGGYMASQASDPQAGDASGRALQEGYVVVIPGSRGRNSTVQQKKKTVYTGRAPKALLDLKAAIRYLREFDAQMPGDAERIITDGTSAGGAMSALMGATGNHPAYESMLDAMGAAKQRDDVFASVCFCPITDLDHADMAYEWIYNCTDSRQQGNSDVLSVSDELKEQFPAYINSLGLRASDGTLLTADNYLAYIKKEIIRAAQLAKNAGADIPDSIGLVFSQKSMAGLPPINGGVGVKPAAEGRQMQPRQGMGSKEVGEYIVDIDWEKYLNYVVSTQPLKTAPAFDTKDVVGQSASGENEEFGDETGSSVNFTDYSASKTGSFVTKGIAVNVSLLNPMNFIDEPSASVAPHWYIRHGARDRDTAFPVAFNLATKLRNSGKDVDFLFAWNRPHSGDYALDELFAWIANIVK